MSETATTYQFGEVVDHHTGNGLRPATEEEWRISAMENFERVWEDGGEGSVYVEGGPFAVVTVHALNNLRTEAIKRGDSQLAETVSQALWHGRKSQEYRRCAELILDARIKAAKESPCYIREIAAEVVRDLSVSLTNRMTLTGEDSGNPGLWALRRRQISQEVVSLLAPLLEEQP